MKEFSAIVFLMCVFTFVVGETGLWEDFHKTAERTHQYEYKALSYSKEIRMLKKQNEALKSEVAKLKSEKEHLKMSMSNKKRSIASIPQKSANDLVNFDLYKWSPEKLLGVGAKALHFKKYDKSAQFYNTLLKEYPDHAAINDKVLFEAGIAAYESKQHFDWAVAHFSSLVRKYPKSKLYRGAKLWLGLAHFHKGNHEKFVATVEEFRSKYRNTREWKVLSNYYEDIAFRYKK
ncbi:MAG: tetratricopeptide repeat protein [Bacteriovoracaceae bacterium]|nr:tetratricopeptide repeat protein [Bacteriovoracaceae bacterium]